MIDLLPALPSAWPEGSMHGLRARGGFTVDLDWAEGKLTTAVVRSTGGTRARLRYGDTSTPVSLRPGGSLQITVGETGKLHIARHG